MAPRTNYSALPDGLQFLNLWDVSLQDMGLLGVIPCTATGTNALTLTPIASSFSPNLTNPPRSNQMFSFVAPATSTGSVTVQVVGANSSFLNLYRMDAATQATTGDIQQNVTYVVSFNSALNSSAGGYQIMAPVDSLVNPNITGATITNSTITTSTYNGNTWTAGTGTLTIAAGKTLTASNTLTFTGTDGSSVAFGAGGTVLYGNQTITLSGDATGSGATAITTTVTKVNGVAYGTSPSTNTVPVVTGSNTVTYETVPNAALANSAITIGTTSISLGASSTTLAGLTSITDPLYIGGSGTTGTQLTLQTTTGAGTTDQMIVTGGNNGGTRIATFLGTGKLGVGSSVGAQTPTNTTMVVSNNVTAVNADQTGTLSPVLHVVGADGAIGSIIVDGYGTLPAIAFRGANGTAASPTVMTSGTHLGAFFAMGYDGSASKYGFSGEVAFDATETWSASAHGGNIKFFTVVNGTSTQVQSMTLQQSGALSVGTTTDPATAGAILANASIKSQGATSGIGYATGAGGTVTQATSRTTGVTLSKVTGAITMFSAAGSATAATFTVTNTAVAATDVIHLSQASGTNLYNLLVTAVSAGSFNITFFTTGGTATDAPVINFAVIKGVTS